MKHQQKHGFVSFERERGQQLVNLLVIHRTRNTPGRFDMDRSSDGVLTAGAPHERTVAGIDSGQGRIIDLVNGILSLRERTRENQVFVERGDGSNRPIDRRRREAGCGSALLGRCREHQAQALRTLAAGEQAEVF